MTSHNHGSSEFVQHLPCPQCGSSDANSLYTDGHTYCFSCGHYEHGEGEPTPKPTYHRKHMPQPEGEVLPLKKRKISEATCRKFGVLTDVVRRRLCFPYGDIWKFRDDKKEFYWDGKPDQLFGQQLWPRSGKCIVITEGEIDALTYAQVRPGWPVCSVPNGADAAPKAIKRALPFLAGYDQVILSFDDDDPGRAAAHACAKLLDPKQAYTTTVPGYKDANEALQAGDEKAIMQSIWQAIQHVPRAILRGSDLMELVTKPIHGRDASWHHEPLDRMLGGLRRGELVTVTAGSGVGKSTFCGELCQALLDQEQTVGYIALEESVQRTALRLMSVKANRPLHLDNSGDLKAAFDASLGTGRVYLRDGFGSVDPDEILNDCRYLAKGLDCGWLILDHLSILLSGNTDDERRLIDVTMTKLRSFTEETGVGLILISHLRRPQGDKGHEQGAKVGLGQLRGSHAIAQLSDAVVALERDLNGTEDLTTVRVLKNRFTGQTGEAGQMCYDPLTGRQKTAETILTSITTNDDDDQPF